MRCLADKQQYLLIIDEVPTGFGVTGNVWAFDEYGVVPDLLTFGKKAQISGVCVAEHIPEMGNVINKAGRLSPTWNGDIADYVRCKHIMKFCVQEDQLSKVRSLVEYIVSELNSFLCFSNVRWSGFLIAFDFEK